MAPTPKPADSGKVAVVPWNPSFPPPTEQEAEARLHQEGYHSFRWHDVPGANYPRHRHEHDECIWILKGSITFTAEGVEYPLQPGDRIYLPSHVHHTAQVPDTDSVTYLVGEKR